MSTALVLTNGAAVRQADSDQQLLGLWLHGRSENTLEAYNRDVARFMGFLAGKALAQVTLGDLQAYSDSLTGLEASSKGRLLSTVKSLFSFGHKIGYLLFNPAAAVALPRLKNTVCERFLDKKSVRNLIDKEKNPRNQALLRLTYITGVRVSEATGVCWKDLLTRESGGQVTVHGKGGKTRMLLVDPATWLMLMALRTDAMNDDSPVFQTIHGTAIDRIHVFKIVRAAAKRAGIRRAVSPHWLRHATATHMLTDGANISEVQTQLGHSNLSTTGKYLHALPSSGAANYLAW